jgi:WD40 repeat protein
MRWMLTISRLAALITVCVTTPLNGNAAGLKRLALVIANSAYTYTAPLNNPLNDATLIGEKLRELGFDVRLEKDVGARALSEIIQEFSTKLDKDSEVLFYYAGHGLQFRGENFLVGIDARLNGEATLQFETFKLNTIINLLEQRASTTLLFWDACRDNPLADQLLRSIPTSLSAPSELVRAGAAALPPPRGDTLIVFSAEPGRKALDGAGEYSPFAESLGHHIASTNIEIESMLKRVSAEVIERTHNYQRPERLSQLTHDYYFHRDAGTELAYEEEIRRLNARIEELQRDPVSRKRIIIVGSSKVPTSTSSLSVPMPKAPPVPTRGAGQLSDVGQQGEDPAAPGAATKRTIAIAVDRATSTVIRKLRISPNGKLLALGDEEGLIRIIRLDNMEVAVTFRAHSGRISDLDFRPDSRILLSAGRDGAIRFWDLETLRENARPVKELKARASIPYSARINPDPPNRFVLMGDREGRLVAWDTTRDHIITNVKFHHAPVLSVAYQPAGKGAFLSAGGDGQLKLRLPEGERFTIHAHDGPMFQANYSATGKYVYTVGGDRMAKVWDTAQLDQRNPHPRAIMSGHFKYVLTADMSQDEKMLVTGGADKALNLWEVATGRLLGHLRGHTSDVESVEFLPNGRFVISASEDNSVRIWSVDNRQELAMLVFQKNGDGYAGVTFDNRTFGESNSGLLSFFIDGKQVSRSEGEQVVQYIGPGIVIIENED